MTVQSTTFNTEQMAWIRKQAAIRDRKTRRRRDQWIYHGIDSKTHQLVALMGEVGAARMMQATTFPTFHAMAYDFIAGGWKVDAKTTRMGKLQVRMGHERKLHANDVMACVYVDEGRTRVDFLGWIWCQEFLARAPLIEAARTEPAWTYERRQLLQLGHWLWLQRCTPSTYEPTPEPPWPAGPGPRKVGMVKGERQALELFGMEVP